MAFGPPLEQADPEVYAAILGEQRRQHDGLELIASENLVSQAVLDAAGSVLTNKYAEGYPGRRYYGGCEFVDIGEQLAIDRAKKLFRAEHANVQPHSGTTANMAVYFAVLRPGDKLMGMDLASGGHLTHGHPLSYSGRDFEVIAYGLDRDTELIDYDAVAALAQAEKPKLIICGASAYSRVIDFARFRAIADSCGALLMADMAHIAGLVAAGVHPSPVPHCDFVTTTTHKTLRGPRGGLILCKAEHQKALDRAVFPGVQGGPLMHIIAAKAVALGEASTETFAEYQRALTANARTLAEQLAERGLRIVSGGTDNHVFLVDLTAVGTTGRQAEAILEKAAITVNKNAIPWDPQPPMTASGIRVGSAAITTRGMGEAEMVRIANWIGDVVRAPEDEGLAAAVREEVLGMCGRF